ncbi:MAG: 30S ribosomal protein S6 [Candidatus Omnitrophica bacterium]|nr:30S ribosomal protein S6 [Candidatus Omnitrophota bacterium]
MEKSRKYTGLFMLDPDKEPVVNEVTGGIKAIVMENAGNVIDEKVLGKRRLTYPVQKKNEAIYYNLAFEAVPSAITKISRLCNINTNIMRTIISLEK